MLYRAIRASYSIRLVFAIENMLVYPEKSGGNMPDGKTHKYVGIAAGAGYAAFQAKEQTPLNLLVEAAGGAFGGWPGAMLPDVFEPGTSSWHRGFAHSCTTGTTIVSMRSRLMEWEKFCREKAELCRVQAEQTKLLEMTPDPSRPNLFVLAPTDPLAQLFLKLEELFWRFLAGFTNGLAAGYVSHLALDAFVGERSIPLLTKGF
jgi:hypothetical protein